MKVLLLNGSPHEKGCTYTALAEVAKALESDGVEAEIFWLGKAPISGCLGCNACAKLGRCVIDDVVNAAAEKVRECDGLVVGTPVYYASANATLVAFLTRLFYSTHFDKTMKVGAAVAAARRGGLTATYDELNKFFGISGMPIASGQYWNGIHGREPGEAAQDAEGLQGMRTLARNMVFLMKSIQLGKEAYGIPEREPFQRTNFIRETNLGPSLRLGR